jgi:hypothetical protein
MQTPEKSGGYRKTGIRNGRKKAQKAQKSSAAGNDGLFNQASFINLETP